MGGFGGGGLAGYTGAGPARESGRSTQGPFEGSPSASQVGTPREGDREREGDDEEAPLRDFVKLKYKEESLIKVSNSSSSGGDVN